MSVVATGDTARIRRALVVYDTVVASHTREPDDGVGLVGAYAHLAVGDSAGALRRLRQFRDHNWSHTSLIDQLGAGFAFSGMSWARTFLLLGELEEAVGLKPAAAEAYRKTIGMWERGDSVVQPWVSRARSGLARVGG